MGLRSWRLAAEHWRTPCAAAQRLSRCSCASFLRHDDHTWLLHSQMRLHAFDVHRLGPLRHIHLRKRTYSCISRGSAVSGPQCAPCGPQAAEQARRRGRLRAGGGSAGKLQASAPRALRQQAGLPGVLMPPATLTLDYAWTCLFPEEVCFPAHAGLAGSAILQAASVTGAIYEV